MRPGRNTIIMSSEPLHRTTVELMDSEVTRLFACFKLGASDLTVSR